MSSPRLAPRAYLRRAPARCLLLVAAAVAVIGIAAFASFSQTFVAGAGKQQAPRSSRRPVAVFMEAAAPPSTQQVADAEAAFKAATAEAAVAPQAKVPRATPSKTDIADAVRKLREISNKAESDRKSSWRPKGNLARDKTSTALVRVTEENSMVAASLLPGAIGLFVGGAWVGAAAFMAGSYLSRQKDNELTDVGQGLRTVGEATITTLNTGADLVEEYQVSKKVGSAFQNFVTEVRKENEQVADGIDKATETFSVAIEKFDDSISLKTIVGTVLTTATELAGQVVDAFASIIDEALNGPDKISENAESKTVPFKATSGSSEQKKR